VTPLNEDIRNQISSYPIDKLLRVGGDFKFDDVKLQIEELKGLTSKLYESQEFWRTFPEPSQLTVVQQLGQVNEAFKRIINFDTTQPNPLEQRNQLASEITSYYNTLYPLVITPLEAHAAQRTAPKDIQKQARATLKDIQDAQSEIIQIKRAVSEAATVAGVTATEGFAKVFMDDSRAYGRIANWWLGGLGVTAIIVGGIGLDLTRYLVAKHLSISQDLIVKLLALSLGLYVVRFVTRNFYANKHLQILNRHRANVLSSIEALLKSVDNPDLKDYIMSAGAKTAFESGETGFLSVREGAGSGDEVGLSSWIDLIKR
jgi:hypothetical protein